MSCALSYSSIPLQTHYAERVDCPSVRQEEPVLIILILNITRSLITSSTTGYDGSMMNGLQSLPQWESAFHNPSNGKLGLLNAIQASVRGVRSVLRLR